MGSNQQKYHAETQFRLESPTGRSKSFRIRYKSPDTDDKWTILSLPEIDKANELLKKEVVDQKHTKEKLKLILASQYTIRDNAKQKAPFRKKNLDLIDKMWEDQYPLRKRRRMKRPQESYNDLKNAALACGTLPIDTCDLDDLEEHLDNTLHSNPTIHARRITWVNSILTWLGRSKISTLGTKGRPSVKYITEDELQLLIPTLPDKFMQDLVKIAFYTGLRLGEIFYLQKKHLKDSHIWVEKQMTDIRLSNESYKIDTTKSGNERSAVLAPQIEDTLKEWVKIPMVKREGNRVRSFSHTLKDRCSKLFPDDDTKHLNFHALRHCNAIWLLQKEVTLYEVAQHLGNHYTVTERYYSGFELKKENIKRIAKLLG